MHKHRYDTEAFWIVFEVRDPDKPLVYNFDSHSEAAEFILGDPEGKEGPLRQARLPLEQAASLLVAAGDATQEALTAFLANPALHKGELLAAADFLKAAADFAKLQPNIAAVYRAMRRDLLQAAEEEQPEPRGTVVAALQEGLRRYKKIIQ